MAGIEPACARRCGSCCQSACCPRWGRRRRAAAHAGRALSRPVRARAARARVRDGKTFVDAVPRVPPAQVMEEFRDQHDDPGFDLRSFVIERFEPPGVASSFAPQPGRSVTAHIDALWTVLVRKTGRTRPGILAAATAASLCRARRPLQRDLLLGFLLHDARPGGERPRTTWSPTWSTNFACLIDRYGHIPNGNRSYYLSRSQPPFFAPWSSCSRHGGGSAYRELPAAARREYEFWMDGADALAPGSGASARGAAAGRRAPQSLLGRPRYAARGVVSRRRADRARCQASRARTSTAICARRPRAAGTSARAGSPTAGRSPRSARSTRAGRPQQPALSLELLSRAYRASSQHPEASQFERRGAEARKQRDAPLSVESARRRVRRLCLAAASALGPAERGNAVPAVLRSRDRRSGARRRDGGRAVACWRRDGVATTTSDGTTMGCAQWLGAIAVDRDRRISIAMATGTGGRDRAALDPGKPRRITDQRQAGREI